MLVRRRSEGTWGPLLCELGVLLLGLVSVGSAFGQQNARRFVLDPYNPEYAPNVVVVKFRDEAPVRERMLRKRGRTGIPSVDRIAAQIEVESVEKVFRGREEGEARRTVRFPDGREEVLPSLAKVYKIRYRADTDPKEVAQMFSGDEHVEYAEPDYYVYIMGWPAEGDEAEAVPRLPKAGDTYPDDPLYQSGDQWYIDAVNAPAAWDSTTGDTTQIIGIIDTGVDWHHPDLDDNIWRNWDEIPDNGIDDDGNGFVDDVRGWDFVNDDNDPMDDNSHGTHVAGIAAAETNNGVGIAGIAWNARIMPVKVLQSSGRGNFSDLAAGIDYAARNGATVINMSLGSYAESQTVKIALENAYAYAVLVAAAGNDGYKLDPPFPPWPPYVPSYPACYPFVLGVEATDISGKRAAFSNFDPSGPTVARNDYGHNYEIRGPGVSIISCVPNAAYRKYNGTSMASPIIAGAVALMKSYCPAQSTEQIFAKLVQGAVNGIVDIGNSLDYALQPDLHFLPYTIVDTLPGDDSDGVADAGETLEIYLTLENGGGRADSVWAKLDIGANEDSAIVQVTKGGSLLGNISTYGVLLNTHDPFVLHIASNAVHRRHLVLRYTVGSKNWNSVLHDSIIVVIENAVELTGAYEGAVRLKPNRRYVIKGNVVFDTLLVDAGTVVSLQDEGAILISGHLVANGKPDSMIVFTHDGDGYWYHISKVAGNDMQFRYCIFEYGRGYPETAGPMILGAARIENCLFRHNTDRILHYPEAEIYRSVFVYNNAYYLASGVSRPFMYNIVTKNDSRFDPCCTAKTSSDLANFRGNIVFGNYQSGRGTVWSFGVLEHGWGFYHLPPNYFGTEDSIVIESMIRDFFEAASSAVIKGDSALSVLPSEAHGIVWKVLINGKNPQHERFDPVGRGTVCFEVYFNRAMDIKYTPFLTFGIREPYTQHIVQDSAHWSPDSTVWTAYYTIGPETGDGINTIRVANARDPEGFEIPIEDSRFKFVIQTMGSAATEFTATPGIGKVDLVWPVPDLPDLLGYNIYRFQRLTDTTFTDTIRINQELVLDTTYTDYDVIPDTTYYYLYTAVGTDLKETDFSKSVAATPFNASPGDANGDLSVNVLDITTIVSYLLHENPQPFLLDAADVNEDGEVNVLDIVALVNMIMGGGGAPKVASAGETSPQVVYSPGGLELRGGHRLAALQVAVWGKGLSEDKVMPGMQLKRMEYRFHVEGDTLYLVAYNLNNATFPEEVGNLFTLRGGRIGGVKEVLGADGRGRAVELEAVDAARLVPERYELFQNYPNPFNPSTVISYGLPEPADVEVAIYNVLGQRVWVWRRRGQSAGYHRVVWSGVDEGGRPVATGVYVCRLKARNFVATRKMLLIQ